MTRVILLLLRAKRQLTRANCQGTNPIRATILWA
jgi:hypothetical protein